MKRLKYIIGVLVLAGSFMAGCSNGVLKDEFRDDPDITVLKGVLLEKEGGGKGTHILDVEKGDDELLRSLLFNLSDKKYLDNEVKISAVYNEEDDVYEVTDIEVIGEKSDVSQEDAELVKYYDSHLGVELKYYNNWTAVAADNSVSFFAPEDDDGKVDEFSVEQIVFAFQPPVATQGSTVNPSDTNDAALIAYVNKSFSGLLFDKSDIEKVGAEQINAISIVDPDGETYYFYRPGLIYKVAFVQTSSNSDNDLVFSDMLNSFRFIAFSIDEQNLTDTGITVNGADIKSDTSGLDDLPTVDMDFTAFESLPYAFEAKYPDQWYYSGSKGTGVSFHHYGFSDEAFETGQELISLDIKSGSAPNGKAINTGKNTIISAGGGTKLYVEMNDYLFEFSGPSKYADIMLIMANSLTSTD